MKNGKIVDFTDRRGENSSGIPLGLDRAPMREIVRSFQELGLNSIRLPFSNEMIHDAAIVPDAAVAANPELRGKTRLQVYDAAVAALTDSGFAVILNNHTNTTRWCCGIDGNERGRDEQDPKVRAWFNDFVDFLIAGDTDFAYWPLVGWHQNHQGNGWGLVHWDAAGNRMFVDDGDDWRASAWHRLANAPTGAARPAGTWWMLSVDHGDLVQSARMRGEPDWNSGARKTACPDGQRLIGLSHTGSRGLCSSTGGAGQRDAGYEVVRDERHVTDDWAPGFTKFQCPPDSFVIGYATRGADLSSMLCAKRSDPTGTTARTVWFDRTDARPPEPHGGEFAPGHHKGQCANDEYITGVAWSARADSPPKAPDALLCQPTHPSDTRRKKEKSWG
ncbi:cellulase family glycosylhydrolase [Saccharopolyspora sp. 5N708]|uniref:cellulase family glycosylhydrolase n=1 Tax=Saccharopolyspora sp. 5N708 TaxID=3457424 RepID=UPI003FD264B9